MRFVIQDKELEFRVQERRITVCSVFHKGKEIASDLAIHAPQDSYDQREGERIAVERVAEILFKRQQEERKESMVKVDKVFTEIGALSGNVELPPLEPPTSIVQKVMAKLDARRVRKAQEAAKKTLTLEELKRVCTETQHSQFWDINPFGPGRMAPRFSLPFGISTKPTGR